MEPGLAQILFEARLPISGLHKDLGFTWDTTYTFRVGMCLTTACDLDDVVFASERTVTTPMEP